MKERIFFVVLALIFIASFANAIKAQMLPIGLEKEISIEEIGTQPKELIEGMQVQLFANISNRGNDPVDIDLEFRLDSAIVGIQRGIKLQPGNFQKIFSDTFSIVSVSNSTIEAIVYLGNTFIQIDRKTEQIVVYKKFNPEQEKNNFNYLSLGFVGPIILIFAGIILLLYLLFEIRRTKELKQEILDKIDEVIKKEE